jgi:hypothetical protein
LIYFNSVASVQQEKASTGPGRTETVVEGLGPRVKRPRFS